MSLAKISPRFFDENPPKADFYKVWQTAYSWSENVMPIYEWDGILYVACAQWPSDFPNEVKAVFLIAESVSLKSCWVAYNPIAEVAPQVTPAKNSSDPFASLMEAPKAAVAKPALPTDTFELLDETVASEIDGEKPAEAEVEELQFLSENERKADAKPATTPLVALKALSADVVKAPEAKIVQPPPPPAPPVAKVMATPPPPPPKVNPDDAPLEAKPAAVKVAASAGNAIQDVFAKMKTHYLRTLILRREGNAVKVWKWDDGFTAPAAQNPITLGIPSPFRIVSKTLKSYHGYVVPNEISDKFFEEFNNGIPDHITLSPIVIEDQLLGMVLAIGEKSINQKSSLILAEKCATELAAFFAAKPDALAA